MTVTDTPNAPQTQPLQPEGEARTLMPGAEPFLYEAGEIGCLLVHGFTATPYEMRELGRYLADRGVTAAGMLLAGHGTSPEDLQGTAWHDWYASVNTALDDLLLRCKRVYLVGLSLGGALTLYTAAHRGGDLAGIVAMSAPVYLPSGLSLVLKGMKGPIPYMYKPFRDIEDPAARERQIGYMTAPVEAIASLVEFLGPVRAALPQVKVPSLVIYARHDHVVPCVSSHHIYSRLGSHDKRMIALHRGYHVVTSDYDKEKVFDSVHKFITDRERSKSKEGR